MEKELKTLWTISVDFYSGKILDAKAELIKRYVFVGNTTDSHITKVSIYPTEADAAECGENKARIIGKTKKKPAYRDRVLKAIFANTIW